MMFVLAMQWQRTCQLRRFSYARAQMHEGDDEGSSDCGWQGRLCV